MLTDISKLLIFLSKSWCNVLDIFLRYKFQTCSLLSRDVCKIPREVDRGLVEVAGDKHSENSKSTGGQNTSVERETNIILLKHRNIET